MRRPEEMQNGLHDVVSPVRDAALPGSGSSSLRGDGFPPTASLPEVSSINSVSSCSEIEQEPGVKEQASQFAQRPGFIDESSRNNAHDIEPIGRRFERNIDPTIASATAPRFPNSADWDDCGFNPGKQVNSHLLASKWRAGKCAVSTAPGGSIATSAKTREGSSRIVFRLHLRRSESRRYPGQASYVCRPPRGGCATARSSRPLSEPCDRSAAGAGW
jgi:hypothetical protein